MKFLTNIYDPREVDARTMVARTPNETQADAMKMVGVYLPD